MKKLILALCLTAIIIACKEKSEKSKDDTQAEVASPADAPSNDEWTELSLDDWQLYMGGEVSDYWKVEDGAMVFYPPDQKARMHTDGKGYDRYNLVSKKEYTSFVLSLEWKISEGGNGGIFWGVKEDVKFEEPYHTGMEIQILDNEKHPDAKNGTTHQAGALYDLVAPTVDATKPVGEWNTCVITVDHGTNKGSSVLNGVEVATFPVGGPELEALLKGSKFEGWEGFGKYGTGRLGLQDHGNMVSFRNIKIKEL